MRIIHYRVISSDSSVGPIVADPNRSRTTYCTVATNQYFLSSYIIMGISIQVRVKLLLFSTSFHKSPKCDSNPPPPPINLKQQQKSSIFQQKNLYGTFSLLAQCLCREPFFLYLLDLDQDPHLSMRIRIWEDFLNADP